ncbi:MAG: PAS domain-containing protein [Candidatus Gracilibacteria bacterium]|jgi:two-component system CheB/CheR fusion protein
MNTNHKNSKKTSLAFPEHVGEIINSIHEPLLVLDQDLNVRMANNAFYRFFKVKAKEVLDKCIYQLNDKQWNIPKLRKLLEEILAKNSFFCDFKIEADFPRIGKQTILLNAVKIICSSDHQESIFLAFEDVGKREEFEEQMGRAKSVSKNLAKELKKFKMVVEASTHLIITDPDDKILYANKGVKVVTGYDPKEMIGKSSGKLWGGNMPKKFYKDMWNTIYKDKKVFRGEVQNKRKNGELYDAEIVITPVLDSKRNVEFFVGTEHDITKLRELDRMKSEFISLASHQLREPLTAIKWFAELLSKNKQHKLNEEQRDYVHGIIVSNERSIRLVSDLLNLSRIEMGHNFDTPLSKISRVRDGFDIEGKRKNRF